MEIEQPQPTGGFQSRDEPPCPPEIIAWTLALGMGSIVVVSLAYLMSPVAAVMPVVPLLPSTAQASAVSGGPAMAWIGYLGIVGDPITAAACAAIGVWSHNRNQNAQAMGWMMIGFASFLFVIVDTIAGTVLAPLSAMVPESGFVAVKLLFDRLFVAGTACLAIGELFVSLPVLLSDNRRLTVLNIAIALNGLLGFVSAFALLFGSNWSQALGASVAVGAALFTVVGVRMANQLSAASPLN